MTFLLSEGSRQVISQYIIWKGSQATIVIRATFIKKFQPTYFRSKYSRSRIIVMKYRTALATYISAIWKVSRWI